MSHQFHLTSDQDKVRPEVIAFTTHYKKHPHNIQTLTKNATPYLYYVYQQTQAHHMPAEIALLPLVESNYNPFLYSKRGATGLWQMMPGTASGFNLTINWWYDGRRDITASTKAALNYLNYLHDYFDDWLLAIAAYNAGEGTVQNAIKHNKALHKPTDFWSLALPAQTKKYVPKMLALAEIIQHPTKYQVTLAPIESQPYFFAAPMQGQIDLSLISSLAKTDISEIRKLNPGFRRWATAPDLDYQLLIPIDKADIFKINLSNVSNEPVTWVHYPIKSGDTLSQLAVTYHTKVSIIKKVNNLTSNALKINQTLLIPRTSNEPMTQFIPHTAKSIAEDDIPGPHRLEHTVVKYDTLTSIGARYHVSAAQLRYWNNLNYHHILTPGQHLIIWKNSPTQTSKTTYIVRSGDSLSVIAKRFHVTTAMIKQNNQLKNSIIKIGQTLTIPPAKPTNEPFHAAFNNQMISHAVTQGETLSGIAQHYAVSTKQLVSWNHLNPQKPLQIGQHIKIYHSS